MKFARKKKAQPVKAPLEVIEFPELEKIHKIEEAINDLKNSAKLETGIERRLQDNRKILDTMSAGVECLKKYYNNERAINELKKSVKLDDGIDKRLQADGEILDLISRAVEQLKKCFPADAEYVLRRTYDLDPNSNCLSLDVLNNRGYDESMAALDKFDDEWWLDNMPRTGDALIVGVRFA